MPKGKEGEIKEAPSAGGGEKAQGTGQRAKGKRKKIKGAGSRAQGKKGILKKLII